VRHLIVAAAEAADRESEERVLLSQELGGTSVESDSSGGETTSSTSPGKRTVNGELTSHKEEESEIEETEEGSQGDVDPQGAQAGKCGSDGLLKIKGTQLGYSQEDKGEDEPGRQKDSDGVGKLAGVIGIGSGNTEGGMEEGSVGQPETAVRGES